MDGFGQERADMSAGRNFKKSFKGKEKCIPLFSAPFFHSFLTGFLDEIWITILKASKNIISSLRIKIENYKNSGENMTHFSLIWWKNSMFQFSRHLLICFAMNNPGSNKINNFLRSNFSLKSFTNLKKNRKKLLDRNILNMWQFFLSMFFHTSSRKISWPWHKNFLVFNLRIKNKEVFGE